MKRLLAAVLFLCFLGITFSETKEVQVNVSNVDQLVNVTSDIEFSKVLVGYQYQGDINVEWAIPSEALKGISTNRVIIGVEMSQGNGSESISFLENNQTTNKVSFDLTCIVVDNACSNDSILSKKVPVVFTAKSDNSSLSSIVVVNAGLTESGDLSNSALNSGPVGVDSTAILNTLKQNGVALVAGIIALLVIVYLIKKV